MTEAEILTAEKVTPEMAGKYLGCPTQFIRAGLEFKCLPFGAAVQGKRWSYYISGQALIKFKREGAEIVSGKVG